MRYLKLLMTVFLMCNFVGCAKAESSEIKGKLWFDDINFPKVEYKSATLGMSYYENGKKVQFYDDRIKPVPSKDGKVLFCKVLDFKNGKYYYELRDLELDKELYRIENIIIHRAELSKTDFNSLFVVKNDDDVYNVFKYSFENKVFQPITTYVEKNRIIQDITVSSDGKYIVYPRYIDKEIGSLRTPHILNLETKQTYELPYSITSVEFNKDSTEFIFSGVKLKDNEVAGKSSLYIYDMKTKAITKIESGSEESYMAIQSITFSPDGTKVAFIKMTNGGANIVTVMNPDGTNQKPLEISGVFGNLQWTE